MSGFSAKVQDDSNSATGTGGGSDITNEQWDEYNEGVWNAFEVASTKDAKGAEVKQDKVIGYLNFIMQIGNQKREVQLDSKITPPKGSEENSPEELARMQSHKGNYFKWVDEYKDGEKSAKRKLCWLVYEEELVLAADFPAIKVDLNSHPANENEGTDIKPFRIDYNGKWQQSFNRTVTNDVNWKTHAFSDSDIKYKIAAAAGVLDTYKADGHDLAHLVGVPCSWTVKMSKKVTDKGNYYNIEIKDPVAVLDIKERAGTFTVAEQLAEFPNETEFCGVLLNGTEDMYSKAQLEQVRGLWWKKAMMSVQIDKNEGTGREGNWFKGINWADSALAKACAKYEINLPQVRGVEQPKPEAKPAEEPKKETPKKVDEPKSDEGGEDFDSDIPF